MDVAAMSVIMSQSQVRADAGIALMDKVMNTAEQQGNQLTEMLQSAAPKAQHPSLGTQFDRNA